VKWLAGLLILFAACCAGRTSRGVDAPPPRDLDLLCEATGRACEDVWDALEPVSAGTISVKQMGQDGSSWLIEEVLCRGLLDRGWTIDESEGSRARPDTVDSVEHVRLEYRVVALGVGYEPLGKGFWRSAHVGRRAAVELAFRLREEGHDRLLWVGRGVGVVSDTIPRSALAVVAHSELSPPVADWPQSRPWVVEAAVTAGLIGLLLAVFYAGTV
jgi:hypothetical protein